MRTTFVFSLAAVLLISGAVLAHHRPVNAQYCSAPYLFIPDNDEIGVTDTIIVTDSGIISDLDVVLQIEHTWINCWSSSCWEACLKQSTFSGGLASLLPSATQFRMKRE